MKKTHEIKEILAQHMSSLLEKYGVKRIGIFGSYVRKQAKKSSDIDILVEFDRPIGWEIVDLHDYLEEILGMKVGLVSKGAVTRKPILWESIQEDLIYI